MSLSYAAYRLAVTLWLVAYGFSYMDRTMLVLLGVDLTITAWHAAQEFDGRLWRYFGAIAGVHIPDGIGILAFTFGLSLALWALAILGLGCGYPWAIGALVGARLGDFWWSHFRPDYLDYRPNPGIWTACLFPGESIFILCFGGGVLLASPSSLLSAVLACSAAFGAFGLILPALGLLRWWPDLRQPRLRPGESIPCNAA